MMSVVRLCFVLFMGSRGEGGREGGREGKKGGKEKGEREEEEGRKRRGMEKG